jgi:GDP-D-mannose dehydratase
MKIVIITGITSQGGVYLAPLLLDKGYTGHCVTSV